MDIRYYIPETPKMRLVISNNKSNAMLIVAYFFPLLLWWVKVSSVWLISIVEVIYYVSTFLLAEYIALDERRKSFRCFKKRIKNYVRFFISALSNSLILQFGLAIISSKIVASAVSPNQQSILDMPLIQQAVLAVIYAPVVEEVVFRLVLRRLISNELLFLFMSGMIFGLLHVISALFEYSIIETFAFSLPHIGVGLFISYLYVCTNSIQVCISIHRFLNAFAVLPVFLLSLRS